MFESTCQQMGLIINVDQSDILNDHENFLQAQLYHNIQLKCDAWVDDCLNHRTSPSPCKTLFDEAYVQYYLKSKGYELQCNELNNFPCDSSELKKLIYENSHNRNT